MPRGKKNKGTNAKTASAKNNKNQKRFVMVDANFAAKADKILVPGFYGTGLGAAGGAKVQVGRNARLDGVAVARPTPANKRGQLPYKGQISRGAAVLTGRDFLGAINPVATQASGNLLLNMDLSPLYITLPRLRQLAALYAKYRYRKMRFEFVSCMPSSAAGNLIAFIEYDVNSIVDPVGGDDNIRLAEAHGSVASWKVWEDSVLEYKTQGSALYTTPDLLEPRWSSPGKLYVIAGSSLDVASYCNIYVDYEVEFLEPRLTNSVSSYQPSGAHFRNPASGETSTKLWGDPPIADYNGLGIYWNGSQFVLPNIPLYTYILVVALVKGTGLNTLSVSTQYLSAVHTYLSPQLISTTDMVSIVSYEMTASFASQPVAYWGASCNFSTLTESNIFFVNLLGTTITDPATKQAEFRSVLARLIESFGRGDLSSLLTSDSPQITCGSTTALVSQPVAFNSTPNGVVRR